MKEEGVVHTVRSRQETKADIDQLKEGIEGFKGEFKEVIIKVATIEERIKAGFIDMKEEFGSMIRVSYADLERRLNALETRIKALEKIVLPQS
jgi:polyhydroxyalkanoate synthesis regulator phasin